MIYICMPAYNEERTIGVVLWKIREVMADFERDYEVLVVDDGSTDGTQDVMEPYTRVMPIHVRRHDRRLGYARSLEALIRAASERTRYPKRDVVVTLQADFTDEPEDIVTLVKRIEGGADVVTGRVRLVPRETPRLLRWTRRVWDTTIRRLRGGEVEGDMLSGFRAYRVVTLRKALEDAGSEPLLTTDGWAANAELLERVLPHSRRTEAVDVHLRYGRQQRASRFHPIQASRELARLVGKRPVGSSA
ncbi:MAG: glycosyltransferase family 2 protein [Gemmatimonadota bacterium]